MTEPRWSGNRITHSDRPGWVRKLYLAEVNARTEMLALHLAEGLSPAVPTVGRHGKTARGQYWVELAELPGSPPLLEDALEIEAVGIALGKLVRRLHDNTRGRCQGLPQRDLLSLLADLHRVAGPWSRSRVVDFLGANEQLLAPPPEVRCLVHRDLRSANLLWHAPEARLCLLDFEVACGGAPEGDLVRLLAFEHPDSRFQEAVLTGYGWSREAWAAIRPAFSVAFAIEMLAWFARRPDARTKPVEELLVAALEGL